MVNREKLFHVLLITCIVLIIVNTIVLIWLFKIADLPQKIEAYFKGDVFVVEEIIDNLASDIEKSYGIKMPAIELHVNLAGRSKTGITYDGDTLHLYISPRVFRYSEGNLRAYFAHEFGHYVLNHLQVQEPGAYSFYGNDKNRDIQAETAADIFVLRFSEGKDLVWVINDLVWGDEQKDDERSKRLAVLSNSQ